MGKVNYRLLYNCDMFDPNLLNFLKWSSQHSTFGTAHYDFRDINLASQQYHKGLERLHGCTGWPGSVLVAKDRHFWFQQEKGSINKKKQKKYERVNHIGVVKKRKSKMLQLTNFVFPPCFLHQHLLHPSPKNSETYSDLLSWHQISARQNNILHKAVTDFKSPTDGNNYIKMKIVYSHTLVF